MNLLAPLQQPVADVMDLAGEAAAALSIVTVNAASRWLPPADTGTHPTLHIVAADSAAGAPRSRTATTRERRYRAIARPHAVTEGPGR